MQNSRSNLRDFFTKYDLFIIISIMMILSIVVPLTICYMDRNSGGSNESNPLTFNSQEYATQIGEGILKRSQLNVKYMAQRIPFVTEAYAREFHYTNFNDEKSAAGYIETVWYMDIIKNVTSADDFGSQTQSVIVRDSVCLTVHITDIHINPNSYSWTTSFEDDVEDALERAYNYKTERLKVIDYEPTR